jgi:ribosomal RNA-processing protein 7
MTIKPVIAGFTVLPIEFPAKPSWPIATTHYLYLRRNEPRIPTPSDRRSLFVTNVAVDSTEAHFRAIFAALLGPGRLEEVTFEDGDKKSSTEDDDRPQLAVKLAAHSKKRKRGEQDGEEAVTASAGKLPSTWTQRLKRSGSTAIVLLVDEKSVELALKAASKLQKSKKKLVWGEGVPAESQLPVGSQWLRAHNRLTYPERATLQSAVDAFFTAYNAHEAEAAQLAKRLRSEPDEDGFVTVTRGGRNAPARKSEAEEARQRMVERQERKKESMTDFYRFQIRERKKAEQDELLRKFGEDRKKVDAMRERRGRFKPES